jgi:putative nucleotidyltransferase with HDIG domain
MINVSGWRHEPGQIISDVTARLLKWMEHANLGSTMTVDQVADEVRIGLCELMQAQSCIVLARQAPEDQLTLMSAADTGFQTLLRDFEPPRFPARALLAVLPAEPFFLMDAPPPVQVLVGELWDSIRDTASLARSNNTPEPQPDDLADGNEMHAVSPLSSGEGPSLVIPLRNTSRERPDGASGDSSSSLSGLAMLWILTPDGTVSNAIKPTLHAAAIQAGGWLAGAMRMERVGASYRNLGAVFANAIDAKDANRTGHSKAVSYYAATVARGMGLSEHDVERVEFAGLLHDIGKISVPDLVLKKESPLTLDELEIIRHATIAGAEWLREVDGLQEIALMVRHQAERYDGGGYPDGLTGEAIPLGARILAVALRFSAMTKPRAHRRAMSVVGGALEAVAQEAGTSLDPRVVNAFLATMGRTV